MKILNENAQDAFLKAAELLVKAVIHTIGPNGTNTAIQTTEGHYDIINDGKTIIECLTSLDAEVSPALETLKQAAFETNRKAGDGTTSTTVITGTLLKGADELIKELNVEPVRLRRLIEFVRDRLIDIVDKSIKREITSEDYEKVVRVAMGSEKYSDLISDAFRFLEKGQRPIVIRSNIDGVEVQKTDGFILNKTDIVHDAFLEKKEAESVNVICLYEQIDRFQAIVQTIKACAQSGKKYILFYNELSQDVLENLLFNYTQGALDLIPVRLGGYGKQCYDFMKFISEYTGATLIDGINAKLSPKLDFVGFADSVVLDKKQVIIKSSKDIKEIVDNFNKKGCNFSTKCCIMSVGSVNKVEREEVYRRIEDAVNSLGNAIEDGIVPGAGLTYVQAYEVLKEELNNLKEEECPQFIKDALNIISLKVLGDKVLDTPIEELIAEYGDICDSATVVKEVIKNSFTIVAQVITTRVLIHENIR